MLPLFRSIPSAVRSALLAGLLLIAFAGAPRFALAALSLTVNNNGDASGQTCNGGADPCSLRSAIEIANTSSNVTIGFLTSYTIVLGSSLPIITANDTTIDAGASTIKLDANNSGQAITINADRVLVNGLRIYGSSSGLSQVYIMGSAVGVKIANNEIGSDSVGGPCNLSPNTYGGIFVASTGGTVVGARAWIYGNTIECNLGSPGEGITLYGTDHVKIGEDALGNAGPAQANLIRKNLTGITMSNNATFISVRNSVITKNNGVGAGSGLGVWIAGSSFNSVSESSITTQAGSGVWIDSGSHVNTIGSPSGGPVSSGNLISGNGLDGVHITDATTYDNFVLGNRIGTDAAGLAAAPNGRNGVMIDNGAHDNQIGATATERNLISGNTGDGIQILNGAHNNAVGGNYIGVNISGTLALSNTNGIAIFGGAHDNAVGGPTLDRRNVIGGSSQHGVWLDGSTTATNTLQANDIGYNSVNFASLSNGGDGVALSNGTFNNTLGGNDAKNFIYLNRRSGIELLSAAHGNQINLNWISYNLQYGVLFDGSGTTGNVISRTAIAINNFDGIGEKNSASGNSWSETSIYDNYGLGIDKFITSDVANTPDPPYLYIYSVDPSTGLVQGYSTNSSIFTGVKVELYGLALDPSGYGEGKWFVGSAYTDFGGYWAITDPAPSGGCYTAYITVSSGLSGFKESSEFSRSNCSLMLPVIRR